MKKLLILYLILFICVSFVFSKEIIIVGHPDAQPAAFVDDTGTHTGSAVDYLKKIADLMNIDVQFIVAPVKRLYAQLEAEEIDAMLFTFKQDKLSGRFVFPEHSFVKIEPCLALKKMFPLDEVTSSEDLSGMTIGFWYGTYVHDLLKHPAIKLEPLTGEKITFRNLIKLARGRIDGFFEYDFNILNYWIRVLGYQDELKLLKMPGEPLPMYTLFNKKSAVKFIDLYDKALVELEKTLTFDQYFEQFLKKFKPGSLEELVFKYKDINNQQD